MRWVLDIIAVLTAAGLVTALVMFNRARTNDEVQIQKAAADVRRIELELKYRSVTKNAELNDFGWPVTVIPAWFEKDTPHNTLVSAKRPWLEVAGESEAKLMHPPIRMAVDETVASFWYNPCQGVVRARVPVMLSDQEAVNLYNRVNSTTLGSIFERERGVGPAKPEAAMGAEPLVLDEVSATGVDPRTPQGEKPVPGAPRVMPLETKRTAGAGT